MNFKALLLVGFLAALSGLSKAIKDKVMSHHQAYTEQHTTLHVTTDRPVRLVSVYKPIGRPFYEAEISSDLMFPLCPVAFLPIPCTIGFFDILFYVLILGAGVMGGVYSKRTYGKGRGYWIGAWYWFWYILIVGGGAYQAAVTWLL